MWSCKFRRFQADDHEIAVGFGVNGISLTYLAAACVGDLRIKTELSNLEAEYPSQ